MPDPTKITYDEFEDKLSRNLQIPRGLLRGMTGVESSGNPDAVSPVGARGRFQVMPETFEDAKRRWKMPHLDQSNEFDNAYVGARYLREQYDSAKGDFPTERARWGAAVSKYHGGGMDASGNVRAVSDGAITTDKHVEKVMKRWATVENENPDPRWNPETRSYNWSANTLDWDKINAENRPAPGPTREQQELREAFTPDNQNISLWDGKSSVAKPPARGEINRRFDRLVGAPGAVDKLSSDLYAEGEAAKTKEAMRPRRPVFNQRPQIAPPQKPAFDFSNYTKAQAAQTKVNAPVDRAQVPTQALQMDINRVVPALPKPQLSPEEERIENSMLGPLLNGLRNRGVDTQPVVAEMGGVLRDAKRVVSAPIDWKEAGRRTGAALDKLPGPFIQGAATLAEELVAVQSPVLRGNLGWARATDEAVARTNRETDEYWGVNPAAPTTLATIGGEAIVGSLPYVLSGGLGAGMKGAALLGAVQNTGSVYREAKAKGSSDEQAANAALIAAPIGTLEGLLGIEGKLGQLGVSQAMRQRFLSVAKDVGQENLTQMLNNLNAAHASGYAKDRRVLDGIVESTIGALAMGAPMQGAGAAAVKARQVGERRAYDKQLARLEAPIQEQPSTVTQEQYDAQLAALTRPTTAPVSPPAAPRAPQADFDLPRYWQIYTELANQVRQNQPVDGELFNALSDKLSAALNLDPNHLFEMASTPSAAPSPTAVPVNPTGAASSPAPPPATGIKGRLAHLAQTGVQAEGTAGNETPQNIAQSAQSAAVPRGRAGVPNAPTAAQGVTPTPLPENVVRVGDQEVTLSPEQLQRWKAEVLPEQARIDELRLNAKGDIDAERNVRGRAMRLAALKREIAEAYTPREQAARQAREQTNYVGKKVRVQVGGQVYDATVTKNSFGKVGVKIGEREIFVRPDQIVATQEGITNDRSANPPASPPVSAEVSAPDNASVLGRTAQAETRTAARPANGVPAQEPVATPKQVADYYNQLQALEAPVKAEASTATPASYRRQQQALLRNENLNEAVTAREQQALDAIKGGEEEVAYVAQLRNLENLVVPEPLPKTYRPRSGDVVNYSNESNQTIPQKPAQSSVPPKNAPNARRSGAGVAAQGNGTVDSRVPDGSVVSPAESVSRESDIYRTKEGRVSEAQLEAIDARAAKREETTKGEHGGISNWARKSFPVEGSDTRTTPLALQPELRRFLGLPSIPANADNVTLAKAAQHTMDALAEKIGAGRSSQLDHDAHVDFLANNGPRLSDAVVDSYARTLAAHRAQKAFENGTAELPEVQQAIKDIENAKVQGTRQTAKAIRETFETIAQAYGLPKTAGQRFADNYFNLKRTAQPSVRTDAGATLQRGSEAQTAEVGRPDATGDEKANAGAPDQPQRTERSRESAEPSRAQQNQQQVDTSQTRATAQPDRATEAKAQPAPPNAQQSPNKLTIGQRVTVRGREYVYAGTEKNQPNIHLVETPDGERVQVRRDQIEPKPSFSTKVRSIWQRLTGAADSPEARAAAGVPTFDTPKLASTSTESEVVDSAQVKYRDGVIYGNRHATSLVGYLREWNDLNDATFIGLNVEVAEAREIARAINEFRREADGLDRTQLEKLRQLEETWRFAADDAKRGSVVYVDADPEHSLADILKAKLHENIHTSQRAVTGRTPHLVSEQWAKNDPDFARIKRAMDRFVQPYPPHEIMTEAVAYVLSGDRNRVGFAHTEQGRKDAAKFIRRYLEEVVQLHGAESLREFDQYHPEYAKEIADVKTKYTRTQSANTARSRSRRSAESAPSPARSGTQNLQRSLSEGRTRRSGEGDGAVFSRTGQERKVADRRQAREGGFIDGAAIASIGRKIKALREDKNNPIPLPAEFNEKQYFAEINQAIKEMELSPRQEAAADKALDAMVQAVIKGDGKALADAQQQFKHAVGSKAFLLTDPLRTLNASGELSILFRQGGLGWRNHPFKSLRALANAAATKDGEMRVIARIKADPDYPLLKQAELDLGLLQEVEVGATDLRTEENRLGRLGEMIPGIAQFERINKTFIALQRHYIAKGYLDLIRSGGREIAVTERGKQVPAPEVKRAVKYINVISGRADLPEKAKAAADLLNLGIYSTRWTVSRFQAQNPVRNLTGGRSILGNARDRAATVKPLPVDARPADFLRYAAAKTGRAAQGATLDTLGQVGRNLIDRGKTVESQIALHYIKNAALSAALGATLVYTTGAQISFDPEDSDFLKLKWGNFRIPLGPPGAQTTLRFTLRMMNQARKTALGSEDGRGEEAAKMGKVGLDFLRSKEAPAARVLDNQVFRRQNVMDVDTKKRVNMGTTMLGEPISFGRDLAQQIAPMYWVQAMKTWEEQGALAAVGAGALEFVGESAGVYDSNRYGSTEDKGFVRREWSATKGQEPLPRFNERVRRSQVLHDKFMPQLQQADFYKASPPEEQERLRKVLLDRIEEQSFAATPEEFKLSPESLYRSQRASEVRQRTEGERRANRQW